MRPTARFSISIGLALARSFPPVAGVRVGPEEKQGKPARKSLDAPDKQHTRDQRQTRGLDEQGPAITSNVLSIAAELNQLEAAG